MFENHWDHQIKFLKITNFYFQIFCFFSFKERGGKKSPYYQPLSYTHTKNYFKILGVHTHTESETENILTWFVKTCSFVGGIHVQQLWSGVEGSELTPAPHHLQNIGHHLRTNIRVNEGRYPPWYLWHNGPHTRKKVANKKVINCQPRNLK